MIFYYPPGPGVFLRGPGPGSTAHMQKMERERQIDRQKDMSVSKSASQLKFHSWSNNVHHSPISQEILKNKNKVLIDA